LAENEKAFVSVEGDFVLSVEAPAVVDLAVGAFDQPPARPRTGLGADTMSTVTPALAAAWVTVEPVWPLSTPRCVMVGATRLALRSSLGDAVRSCTSAGVRMAATRMPSGVDQHMAFDTVDFVRAVEPTRPGDRARLERTGVHDSGGGSSST
jgi:hypothetical protein